MDTLTAPIGIRKGLTMSNMGFLKPKVKEKPISDETFSIQRLDYYRQVYDGFQEFRKTRERAARFFNNDQHSDLIDDGNGNWITEEDDLISKGHPVLKQNLIKSAVRTLLGQFGSNTNKSVVVARTPEKSQESEMLSNALQYSLASVNSSKILDARALEEFFISGLPIQVISWEYVPKLKKKEVVIRNVNPTSWACNNDIEDVRGNDMRVIVRLMDLTMDEVIVNFGTTTARKNKLKEIYSANFRDNYIATDIDEKMYNQNFYTPFDQSKCRVISTWEQRLVEQMYVHDWMNGTDFYTEWTQKELDQANAFRVSKYAEAGVPAEEVPMLTGQMENVQKWFYAYYSPYGHVLREDVTPFEHGGHPYIATPYPLLDNKIVGIVTDLIDAQKQVNSLLILQRAILASSIKNTLLYDVNTAMGKSEEQLGDEFKQIGAVMFWDPGPNGVGKPPKEVTNGGNALGISEMIQMYLKMIQDVSGVNPAMQGQQAQSGTSGKLYDAQINQSTMNSKDAMDFFCGLFIRDRDMTLLKTIQQYYTEPRMLAISGKAYKETAVLYDPEKVKDIDFDLTIGQTSDSPVYRTMIDDTLMTLLNNGMIDLSMFLENTTAPFSSQLLDSVRKRQEQLQGGDANGAVNGLTQDVQAAGVGGNMQTVNNVSQGLRQNAA